MKLSRECRFNLLFRIVRLLTFCKLNLTNTAMKLYEKVLLKLSSRSHVLCYQKKHISINE